jgi:hypothetical protein
MTVILIFGAAVGAILGLRHLKVFALVPVMLLVAAGAIANGAATGLDPRTIGFDLLVAVVSSQIGYLVTSVGVSYIVAECMRVRATNRRPVLLHAMQMMIGQELRAAFKLPQAVPREMVALLAQMDGR